jgi:hypothetical protein
VIANLQCKIRVYWIYTFANYSYIRFLFSDNVVWIHKQINNNKKKGGKANQMRLISLMVTTTRGVGKSENASTKLCADQLILR